MGSKVPSSLKRCLSHLAMVPRRFSSFSSWRSSSLLDSSKPHHNNINLRSLLSPYYYVAAASSSSSSFRSFSSRSLETAQGPASIDYSSLVKEEEFHRLANSTVHDLQEKFEEYGDTVEIDGFDVEYGNEVLTVKLGRLGTYVLNKQTPNRQLWLSSPLSGPSRYDWDQDSQAWVYRRTKANLLGVLENEFKQLCGEPIKLA